MKLISSRRAADEFAAFLYGVKSAYKKVASSKNSTTACKSSLTIKQSLIPGAGLGVFATNRIEANEILCFYPGVYYPPAPVWAVTNPMGVPAVILSSPVDESYTINCSTFGGLIDASGCRNSGPYTAAHLVNHPAKGMKANVTERDFKWCDVVDSHDQEVFNSVAKGPWFADPMTGECHDHTRFSCMNLAGMCFLSTSVIMANEELYFDYKIHKSFRPNWYPKD
jgi:hypothetical protein